MTVTKPAELSTKSIEEASRDFVASVLESERRYIAAFWHDPVGGHDAAFRHGLHGSMFRDARLGYAYQYLVAISESGHTPKGLECLCVIAKLDPGMFDVINLSWLRSLACETDFEADEIDRYAEQVRLLSNKRFNAAQGHLAEFHKLTATYPRGTQPQPETPALRRTSRLYKRNDRRRARHHARTAV